MSNFCWDLCFWNVSIPIVINCQWHDLSRWEVLQLQAYCFDKTYIEVRHIFCMAFLFPLKNWKQKVLLGSFWYSEWQVLGKSILFTYSAVQANVIRLITFLRRCYIPNLKVAWFVYYLKNYQYFFFFKNNRPCILRRVSAIAHHHTHLKWSCTVRFSAHLNLVKLYTSRYKMHTYNTPEYLEKCYL